MGTCRLSCPLSAVRRSLASAAVAVPSVCTAPLHWQAAGRPPCCGCKDLMLLPWWQKFQELKHYDGLMMIIDDDYQLLLVLYNIIIILLLLLLLLLMMASSVSDFLSLGDHLVAWSFLPRQVAWALTFWNGFGFLANCMGRRTLIWWTWTSAGAFNYWHEPPHWLCLDFNG